MPLDCDDFEDAVTLYKNPKVRQFLGGPVEAEIVYRRLLSEIESDSATKHWVIRLKQKDQFVGIISLGLHHDGSNQEISYQLLPEWWGCGYASETVEAVIEYALNRLSLPQVVAETQTANVASCRLLERQGMHLERKIERFGEEQAIYVKNRENLTN